MTYDSSGILCRRCLSAEVEEENLREYLDGYAASLPPEVKAEETVYAQRLSLCEECSHRIRFTCTLCGCYIQARAAKKFQKCPIPGAPRWSADLREADE